MLPFYELGHSISDFYTLHQELEFLHPDHRGET